MPPFALPRFQRRDFSSENERTIEVYVDATVQILHFLWNVEMKIYFFFDDEFTWIRRNIGKFVSINKTSRAHDEWQKKSRFFLVNKPWENLNDGRECSENDKFNHQRSHKIELQHKINIPKVGKKNQTKEMWNKITLAAFTEIGFRPSAMQLYGDDTTHHSHPQNLQNFVLHREQGVK